MLTKIIGLFLVAHGVAHVGLAASPIPNDPDSKPGAFFTATTQSWLLPRLGLDAAAARGFGIAMVALAALGFLLAGLGALGVPGLSAIWRPVAVVAACASLLLLIVYWQTRIMVGF